MPPAALRIAIVKPEAGVIGGFERVVQRVAYWLRSQGHAVRVMAIRSDLPPGAILGRTPSSALERAAPAFVTHLTLLAAFSRVDLSDVDLVISTLPPSHAVTHRRHLALFYHHDRMFYDLCDLIAGSGYVPDAELHLELAQLVRDADASSLAAVTRFLIPSRTVADRLHRYNGVDAVLPFHAGLGWHPAERPVDVRTGQGTMLCVSRHELPKRTELFVASAHELPELRAVCVGTGTRFRSVQALDRRRSAGLEIDFDDAWRRRPSVPLTHRRWGSTGRVRFVPNALGHELEQLYRQASCFIAPAFDEDYGLTAIEAMAMGVPLVVCDDGGSLAELVEEHGAGEVVPPRPSTIAAAVQRIMDDTATAQRYRDAGRQAVAKHFTWSNAFAQLQRAIDAVMEGDDASAPKGRPR